MSSDLKTMQPDEASRVITGIGKRGCSSENVGLLMDALDSPHWTIRQEAAGHLRKWGRPVIETLMSRHKSATGNQRFWILKIVAQVMGAECLPLLRKAYGGEDPSVRSHVVGAVAEIPGDEANTFLVSALDDDSWLTRHSAASYLEGRGRSVLKTLQRGFTEGSGDVKYWCLRLLVKIFGPEAEPVLRKGLLNDDANIRHYAIMAMEEVREDWGDHLLLECFRDPNWTNRKAAVKLLTRRGRRAVPALSNACEEGDPDTIYWCVQTLGEIGEESCVQPLARVLNGAVKDEHARWAIEALVKQPYVRSAECLLEAVPGSGDLKADLAKGLKSMGSVAVAALLPYVSSPNAAVADFVRKVLLSFDYPSIPTLLEGIAALEKSERSELLDNLRVVPAGRLHSILSREKLTATGLAAAASGLAARGSIGLNTISISLKDGELSAFRIKEGKGKRAVDFPDTDTVLRTAVDNSASDVHLKVGLPPIFRIDGRLNQTDLPIVTADAVADVIEHVTTRIQFERFKNEFELDFAYEIPGVCRFRVNCYQEIGGAGVAFRTIPSRVMSLTELNFPQVVRDLASLKQGLIIVTGPTGSGKSTTLAALIDFINSTREEHIITVEDPVEFLHEPKRSVITYRELHTHTHSFANALRASLREDPDVILVGEMRDLETIRLAIVASETGHLVLSTLHTTTAAETIDRILNIFPAASHNLIRKSLAQELKAIISQILVPSMDGHRVAALEILTKSYAVANLIREEKLEQIDQAIIAGRKQGMQSRDDHLVQLCRQGVISRDTAYAYAHDREIVQKMMSTRLKK